MNQGKTMKIIYLIGYKSLTNFVKTERGYAYSVISPRIYPIVGLPSFFYCFKYRYYFLVEQNVCIEKYPKKSCQFNETLIATVIARAYLIWKEYFTDPFMQ